MSYWFGMTLNYFLIMFDIMFAMTNILHYEPMCGMKSIMISFLSLCCITNLNKTGAFIDLYIFAFSHRLSAFISGGDVGEN